jgi:hypothetical protein
VNLVLRAGCLLPLAFVACTTVAGQNRLTAQTDGRPTILRGARVVVGDGRVIEDAAVLVQDGLLFEVGRSAAVVPPRGAAVVNVSGKTIIPAIVNAHTHLGWEKYTSWGSGNFTRDNLIDHLYRHAYYGVGTVISTASDRESIGLPVALDQKLGKIGGPAMFPNRDSERPAAAPIQTSPAIPDGGDPATASTSRSLRLKQETRFGPKLPKASRSSRSGSTPGTSSVAAGSS